MRGTPLPSRTISCTIYIEPCHPVPSTEDILMRIPGRNSERGEITHKFFKDMNRKERRALMSGKK